MRRHISKDRMRRACSARSTISKATSCESAVSCSSSSDCSRRRRDTYDLWHEDSRAKGGNTMGKPLCYTCCNAIVMRGAAEGQERVFCEALYPDHELTFLPHECSSYGRIHDLGIEFMEKIAWTVKKD